MRQAFCNGLVQQALLPEFVFLTGDLGFKALEPLRDAMGPRFINAGVSEQNMVSVAAGLARSGMRPWTYSIAPFLYARPFEQIRNDVCFHDLPVILVGNGGGYGYGVMGSSHHALEDYGCLLTLPHLRAFVPAFDSDVSTMIPALMQLRWTGLPAAGLIGRAERMADSGVCSVAQAAKRQRFGPGRGGAVTGWDADRVATIRRGRAPRGMAGKRIADRGCSASIYGQRAPDSPAVGG